MAWFAARPPAADRGLDLGNLSRRQRGTQHRVHPDDRVRNAHDLAELLAGRLVDGDEVPQRLAHLLDAVGTDEQGHGQDGLRGLSARALQLPSDQVVERLIGATELDVGPDLDRIDALQQGVHELREADGRVRLEPASEVVAFEQLGDRHLPGVTKYVGQGHRSQPAVVVHDLAAIGIEDAHQLVEVALSIGDDLVGALGCPGCRPPGRIADLTGEATHDQHRGVPEVLELTQLAQDHRVPEGQLGPGRVDPELHPQRALLGVRGEHPLGQAVGRKDLGGPGGKVFVRRTKLGGKALDGAGHE